MLDLVTVINDLFIVKSDKYLALPVTNGQPEIMRILPTLIGILVLFGILENKRKLSKIGQFICIFLVLSISLNYCRNLTYFLFLTSICHIDK